MWAGWQLHWLGMSCYWHCSRKVMMGTSPRNISSRWQRNDMCRSGFIVLRMRSEKNMSDNLFIFKRSWLFTFMTIIPKINVFKYHKAIQLEEFPGHPRTTIWCNISWPKKKKKHNDYQRIGFRKRQPLIEKLLRDKRVGFDGQRRQLRKLQELGIKARDIAINIQIHLSRIPQMIILAKSLKSSNDSWTIIQNPKTTNTKQETHDNPYPHGSS